uniref:Cytochrome P450 n=1 Tax=Scoparia dulcis TaxID=107240 RepID=A0A1W7HBN8_SCODU
MENILLLVLAIIPIIFAIIRYKSRGKTRLPPGPPGLPLIGNLHQLKEPLHEYFFELSKKYGPLLFLKLGSRPVLVANSSRLAEEIMKTQDLVFCSRPSLLGFRKLSYEFYDIALSPYTEYWREMRKITVLHLLSTKQVQSFRPILEDEVGRLVQEISDQASKSETINMNEKIVFLMSTIICRIAFGKRYEPGTGESEEFRRMIQEFQSAVLDFYFTDYFPWIGFLDKLTGKISHLDKIFKDWDAFYQQILDEHLSPDRPESLNDDIVDIMLQLREDESGWAYKIPLDHIKAVLMNVYFASADTITTTMLWTMTALMRKPDVLKKAQAEVRALPLVENKHMVSEEDIAAVGLPYVNAVIKEALRLHTTLPLLIPRETREKCTIDGYEIPAKTMVYVNVWAAGNDPNVWENPEEFKPERFLGDDERFSTIDFKGQDFNLTPFGAGRRGCPGITMGLAIVQLALANLLYMFDWDLPDGLRPEDVDIEIFPGMASHKKNPLFVMAKKYA